MNVARPGAFLVLVALVAVAPLVVHYPVLLTQALIFGLLAAAFNLLLGELGFLSFGQATFNGLGAYAAGLLLVHVAHVPILVALLVAALCGAGGALVVGALSMQGAGVYAVMLTFAFNELAFYLAFQLRDLTGGDNGLRGVVRPEFIGISLAGENAYYYFVAAVFLVVFYALLRLIDSPFGHVLRAIRENEPRARAIGYDTRRFKVTAFTISGAVSGIAGAAYAMLYGFVPLEVVNFDTSTNIVIMGLLGGTGSPYGAIVGAAIFTLLSDRLSRLWAHWPLLLGILFCTVVLTLRGGVIEIVHRLRPSTPRRKAPLRSG
ncbi:MAG: branched-chain amino acid ABC transporter permease [Candidatus Eremiobacteraeota bacterium]|nr:branched-chain amino acid ABC transporter permease [Candidatus Eremiobacteraeota bacterium]